MRIAVIHSFYDRKSPSGENSVVEDQVAQLRAVGHDVELIARYSDELATNPLYPVLAALGTASQRGPDPGRQLAAFGPDVVHCHNLFPNFGSGWLGTWATRTVATVHNYRSVCAAATMHRDGEHCQLCPQQSSLNAVKHRCYRDSALASAPLAWATRRSGSSQRLVNEARHLVFLNDEASDTMIALLRRDGHSVVPNFVREPALKPVTESGPHSDSDYDSASGTWLFAGRLTEEKGTLTLLRNWPRSRRLRVIGDGPLREQVQAYAAKEPQTFSYRGIIPRGELLRELDAAFALVVPSLWREGLPTIVLEALACRTPVLLSQLCSSTADLVAKGGVVAFDPRNAAGLRAAVGTVEAEQELLVKQAASTYDEHFSPDAWTARMEPIYHRVAGGV